MVPLREGRSKKLVSTVAFPPYLSPSNDLACGNPVTHALVLC